MYRIFKSLTDINTNFIYFTSLEVGSLPELLHFHVVKFNMLLPNNIGKLKPEDFGNAFTERHITFTNKRRKHINKTMMKQKCSNKKYLELEKLDYDDNSQNVQLIEDMPIIARKNAKEYDIFNNEQFIIKDIDFEKENIIITDNDEKLVDIPFNMFQKLFYLDKW